MKTTAEKSSMPTPDDRDTLAALLEAAKALDAEERELCALQVKCEAWFAENGIDWDKEYGASVNGDNRRMKYHRLVNQQIPDARERLANLLTPAYGIAWNTVAWMSYLQKSPDDYSEKFRKANDDAKWVTDTLKRVCSPEDYGAVVKAWDMPDEQIADYFEAEKVEGCPYCGGKASVRVKSKTSHGHWQVWDRCEGCGKNINGGGCWLSQEEMDLDAIPEAKRGSGHELVEA